MQVDSGVDFAVGFGGLRISDAQKTDIIVNGRIVVEHRAAESLHPIHRAQIISYLKVSKMQAGILINFNVARLKDGLDWFVHPDLLVRNNQSVS